MIVYIEGMQASILLSTKYERMIRYYLFVNKVTCPALTCHIISYSLASFLHYAPGVEFIEYQVMIMNSTFPDPGYVRAAGFSTLITTIFAFVWGLTGGLATFGVVRVISLLIVSLVSILLFAKAIALFRLAGRLPPTETQGAETQGSDPFRNRLYQIAVFAQFVVIFIVARLLSAMGYADAIISAVAVIVGLHFFALIPAFQSWRFAAIGGAMVVLGLASLLVDPVVIVSSVGEEMALRRAVVGFGCAIILWAGIIPFVLQKYT